MKAPIYIKLEKDLSVENIGTDFDKAVNILNEYCEYPQKWMWLAGMANNKPLGDWLMEQNYIRIDNWGGFLEGLLLSTDETIHYSTIIPLLENYDINDKDMVGSLKNSLMNKNKRVIQSKIIYNYLDRNLKEREVNHILLFIGGSNIENIKWLLSISPKNIDINVGLVGAGIDGNLNNMKYFISIGATETYESVDRAVLIGTETLECLQYLFKTFKYSSEQIQHKLWYYENYVDLTEEDEMEIEYIKRVYNITVAKSFMEKSNHLQNRLDLQILNNICHKFNIIDDVKYVIKSYLKFKLNCI